MAEIEALVVEMIEEERKKARERARKGKGKEEEAPLSLAARHLSCAFDEEWDWSKLEVDAFDLTGMATSNIIKKCSVCATMGILYSPYKRWSVVQANKGYLGRSEAYKSGLSGHFL